MQLTKPMLEKIVRDVMLRARYNVIQNQPMSPKIENILTQVVLASVLLLVHHCKNALLDEEPRQFVQRVFTTMLDDMDPDNQ